MSFAETFPDRHVVDGVSLETQWVGPGPDAAPSLVLLHEGLGCVSTWGRFPERLSEATNCGVFMYSPVPDATLTNRPPWFSSISGS